MKNMVEKFFVFLDGLQQGKHPGIIKISLWQDEVVAFLGHGDEVKIERYCSSPDGQSGISIVADNGRSHVHVGVFFTIIAIDLFRIDAFIGRDRISVINPKKMSKMR